MTFSEAIAREEGFYTNGSRPQRNNNPGDLLWGDEAQRFGATHGDPHFAVFPDVETGWDALKKWLSVKAKIDGNGNLLAGYLGAPISKVIYRFAPPGENNSSAYLRNVCAWAEVTPDTILTAEIL